MCHEVSNFKCVIIAKDIPSFYNGADFPVRARFDKGYKEY